MMKMGLRTKKVGVTGAVVIVLLHLFPERHRVSRKNKNRWIYGGVTDIIKGVADPKKSFLCVKKNKQKVFNWTKRSGVSENVQIFIR